MNTRKEIIDAIHQLRLNTKLKNISDDEMLEIFEETLNVYLMLYENKCILKREVLRNGR